ncbi:MAG: hypothetical protein ABJC36_10895, partial [Gemmatimonadales bacterium]
MSGTGFVDTYTQRAGRGSVGVPELGTFSPLAGPTIGRNGTVLLGSQQGKVIALHHDGSAYWNRQLEDLLAITAPPAVGSDGSVYVIGSMTWTDHRTGRSGPGGRAKLYRFTHDGGVLTNALTDFPFHEPGPTVVGAPEVVHYAGQDVVIVPAIYPTLNGVDFHLIAFAADGCVLHDHSTYLSYGDVTEGGSWELLAESIGLGGWENGVLPPPAGVPFPGVAIEPPNPQGGDVRLVAINRFNNQTHLYRFCLGACQPEPGFHPLEVTPHQPALLSSPVMLPDSHTAIGSADGVEFAGPSGASQPAVSGLGEILATPSLAADGRLLLVSKEGSVIGLDAGGAVRSRLELGYGSIARAAASANHVFVSTTQGLYTLDATGSTVEFHFPWVNGGIWSPAIGPAGHVYAMAANVLFVFPAPRMQPIRDHPLDTEP